MKKIISLVIVTILGILLTSCVLSNETTIKFIEYPKTAYIKDSLTEEKFKESIVVEIDGKNMNLKAAEEIGAVVTGISLKENGTYTLAVVYKSLVLTYQYKVYDGTSPVTPQVVDISWYTGKSSPYSISNAEELLGLSKIVNDGTDNFKGKIVNLTSDINLEGIIWTPIGEGNRATEVNYNETNDCSKFFQGTFNGNNHTINNLSDLGYIPSVAADYTASNGTLVSNGYTFGLFGIVLGGTYKNVKFENVQINGISSYNPTTKTYSVYNGDSVAALIGYNYHADPETSTVPATFISSRVKTLNVENVHVLSGNIKAFDAASGIIGRSYNAGEHKFDNCSNNASIISTRSDGGGKAAGIVTIISVKNSTPLSTKNTITIKDCTSRGEINCSTSVYAAGIVSDVQHNYFKWNISNNYNYGKIISLNDSENIAFKAEAAIIFGESQILDNGVSFTYPN